MKPSRYFAADTTEADLFSRYCRTIGSYELECIMERYGPDSWRADVALAEWARREEARMLTVYPAP